MRRKYRAQLGPVQSPILKGIIQSRRHSFTSSWMAREYPETLSTERLPPRLPECKTPGLTARTKVSSPKTWNLIGILILKPYSKGPCTQLNEYFGPENLYRDYSKANVYVLYGLGIYVCQEATSPRTRSLVTRVAGRAKQNDPG